MQQGNIQQKSSEEVLTLANITQETLEPSPYTRRETIFTMIGVLSVVFLAMLDQTILLMAMTFFLCGIKDGERTASGRCHRLPGIGAKKWVMEQTN